MQPKSLHGAAAHGSAPGFRVLNEDAASAVIQRHALPSSSANVTDDRDAIRRRPDRTIDFDFYRRRAAAPRARAPRDAAVWLSAGAGVLTMAAIYLALFLAAAHMRASNDIQPVAPAMAIPGPLDARF
jgi:hypothetical protein